jgi:hypothetical protein
MSIEIKFRTYLATLDGSSKDFSSVAHLFDELYHNEFTLEENGSTVTREQMKRIQAKAFELGSKATLLYCSASSSAIEYRFHLINDQWDFVIHCMAAVKDDKLYRAQPVEGSNPLLLINILTYVAEFDGTPKPFSEVSNLCDDIYHDDFVYQADGTPMDKAQVKKVESDFFALGSKATLLLLKEVGSDSIQFKFRLVNDKMDVVICNLAEVKNNKLVSSKPVDDTSKESVSKVRKTCETFEAEMMSLNAVNKSVDSQHELDNTISAPQ